MLWGVKKNHVFLAWQLLRGCGWSLFLCCEFLYLCLFAPTQAPSFIPLKLFFFPSQCIFLLLFRAQGAAIPSWLRLIPPALAPWVGLVTPSSPMTLSKMATRRHPVFTKAIFTWVRLSRSTACPGNTSPAVC